MRSVTMPFDDERVRAQGSGLRVSFSRCYNSTETTSSVRRRAGGNVTKFSNVSSVSPTQAEGRDRDGGRGRGKKEGEIVGLAERQGRGSLKMAGGPAIRNSSGAASVLVALALIPATTSDHGVIFL